MIPVRVLNSLSSLVELKKCTDISKLHPVNQIQEIAEYYGGSILLDNLRDLPQMLAKIYQNVISVASCKIA